MRDSKKSHHQLLEELARLRQRVAALESPEEALRQSEQRYRMLTESTTDMIFILNRSGDVLYANRSAAAGIRYDAESLVGLRQDDLFSPEKIKTHLEGIAWVFETGKVIDEDGMYHFGPNEIWLNTRLMPMRDESGNVTAVMGVARDITDRKRAEAALKQAHDELEQRVEERTAELTLANEALRQSCRELRTIYDQITDGITITDVESGCIVQANSAFCHMLGLSAEDLCHVSPQTVHPPECLPKVQEHLQAIEHGGVARVSDLPFIRTDGRVVHADVVCSRIEYNQRPCWISFFHEITKRKQAEAALRQSHDELHAIYDGMVEGLLIADAETRRLVRANAAICRMLAYSQSELLSLSVPDIHPAETLAETLRGFQAEAEGRVHLKRNVSLLRKDGSVFYADIVTHTLTYDGRPCVVGFFRDNTEQKQSEEALAESEAKYRHLVETTDTGYLILDEEGRVVDANDEYVRLTGRRCLADILGRRVEEWTASHDVQRNAEEVAKCVKAGTVRQLEIDYVGPDGKVIPVEINASVVTGKQGRRIISLCRDITDRKQVAEALRQSEQKYKGLVEASPDAVIIADVKGTVLFASHHAWEFLGFSDDEDMVGRSVFDFVIETDRPRLAANVPNLMQTRIRRNTEYTARRKDGSTFPVEISSAAGPNTAQQPWAILAVVRNISERKQAEETLRQSEEKYRGLVDISPDSIVVSDLSGKTLFVSKQTWRLLGVPEEEELVGRSTYDYVIEADRLRLAANYADLLDKGQRGETEYTAIRRDGTTVPVELSSVISRDAQGRPTGAMAIIRDISERKRAEEKLQQHYEELRAIYDGMAEGLVILDIASGDCIRANRSMCEMLGYSEEELKALPVEKLYPPEMLPARAKRHQAMVEGRISYAEDIPLLRKDGSIVYVDIMSDRITYDGRPCLIHLLRDTTERRQAREALRKEHHTLKHLLRSSDHERQLIAYEIHDGLAQQLAGALMQIETYWHQKEAKPQNAAKAYDAALTMLRQAHFETRRLISGVRPPILDESGVVAAVAHLVNEQRLQHEQQIEFHGEVSFDRLVPILENTVYRVVQEALMNACRHSKSDRVRVEVVQCNNALRIKVQDWGVGFNSAAVREDHFGLEGIRERARLLGGATVIESSPGRGTSITVELPLVLRED
jgi:PAS domain S-box-containing protein